MSTRLQIEPSERETIFGQLKRKRKWTGRRNGHTIRLWTRQAVNGVQICYQVSKRHLNVNGHSYSVSRAIEFVNEVLRPKGAAIASHAETMPLASPIRKEWQPRPASQEWLPYADN